MVSSALKMILASTSPRRAELLREAGYEFDVVAPELAEPEPRSAHQIPEHWAEALSYFKARSVARRLSEGLVLAADTLVSLDDQIIGKPADLEGARRILQSLSGSTHRVITGVTLLDVAACKRLIRSEVTAVTMRPLSEESLESYLQSGLWRGKAGAYGIQDGHDANIARIDGSYSNVVGLPMELVDAMLAEFGVFSVTSRVGEPRAAR